MGTRLAPEESRNEGIVEGNAEEGEGFSAFDRMIQSAKPRWRKYPESTGCR
ncbi:MAG: hypothetical protein K2Q34_03790 [Alphaproteobacteria bacterium]|nr:hypothetical protein [Alphaproteobacteria bacterium]